MRNKVTKQKKYNSASRQLPIYRQPRFYIILVLVIIMILGIYLIVSRTGSSNKEIETSNNTIGAVPSKTEAKGENSEEEDKNAATGKKQTPSQYDGDDPNKLDEITGYISYSAVNYDNYNIRLTINQYLTSGSCELALTSADGQVITKTAPVVASASTSTCQGFDIPLSELSSSNSWQISINISAEYKKGTITGDISL